MHIYAPEHESSKALVNEETLFDSIVYEKNYYTFYSRTNICALTIEKYIRVCINYI